MNNYCDEFWEDNTFSERKFRFDYNCGGYALKTNNWYCPSAFCEIISRNSSEVNSNIIAYYCKKEILDSIDGIREIKNISELKENEYGIAFKACYRDFHFCKFENGIWSHKMGIGEIEALLPEQVFSKKWNKRSGFNTGLNYDSKTIYFAVKEE